MGICLFFFPLPTLCPLACRQRKETGRSKRSWTQGCPVAQEMSRPWHMGIGLGWRRPFLALSAVLRHSLKGPPLKGCPPDVEGLWAALVAVWGLLGFPASLGGAGRPPPVCVVEGSPGIPPDPRRPVEVEYCSTPQFVLLTASNVLVIQQNNSLVSACSAG